MSKLVEKFTSLVADAGPNGLECAVFLRSGVQMPGLVSDEGEGVFRVRTAIAGPDKQKLDVDAFFMADELVFFQVPVKQHIIRPNSPIKLI